MNKDKVEREITREKDKVSGGQWVRVINIQAAKYV